VVDELVRALRTMTAAARAARPRRRRGTFAPFDAPRALADALAAIDRRLRRTAGRRRRRG